MKLAFLGTGSAINSNRTGCSILLNDSVLIDAPPGVAQQIHRGQSDLHGIRKVFVTHLHGDHVFGLPFLLLEFMLNPRKTPLLIYAHDSLQSEVEQLVGLAFPESVVDKLLEGAKPQYSELPLDDWVACDQLSLKALEVSHGKMETYGYAVRSSGGSNTTLFYAPDLEYEERLSTYVEDSDVLILDATTLDFQVPGHMTLVQLIEIAEAHPGKRFFATHLSIYDVGQLAIPENLTIPEDGDVFELT